MKNFEKIILIIIIIAAIVGIGFLWYGYYQKLTRTVQNPVATIEVENIWNNKSRIISRYSTKHGCKHLYTCKPQDIMTEKLSIEQFQIPWFKVVLKTVMAKELLQ